MTEPAAASKSADAYRTISEVAADLQLPQHVLRFWETRFPQVKPLKRAGGRRFYRPEDIELLRALKALLYGDGYTIKGVQRLLREKGSRTVAGLAASSSRGGPPRSSPTLVSEAADAPAPPAVDRTARSDLAASSPPEPDAPRSEARGGRSADPAGRDAAARLRDVLAALDECARLLAATRADPRRAELE